MGLTASMWTSVSGLLAHGEKMGTISNNISNVNTVGYKSQRTDFADYLYQSVGTNAGVGQVGCGTSVGIIMNDFSQGAVETTTRATDIAINGNGFFRVSPRGSAQSYYTRAGNFHFQKDGYLVDPNGFVLQGWAIDNRGYTSNLTGTSGVVGTGSPVDVKLDTFSCAPKHTTHMTMYVNLSAEPGTDDTTDAADPFFALLKTWDATQDPPLGDTARAYQSTIEVYDEGGILHKLTVYFDRVDGDTLADGTTSESYWEYVVTMDPSEDVRDFNSAVGDQTTTPNVPDNLKGILGAGTMTFNSSGQMTDMTCFVPDGTSWWGATTTDPVTGIVTADADLSKFVAAPIDVDGFPVFAPNFSGTAGLSTAYRTGDYTRPNPSATGRLISANFGMSSLNHDWTFANVTTPTGAGGLVSAADIADSKINAQGMGSGNVKLQNTTTTCVGTDFVEKSLIQDGYTYGDLRYVTVSSNGVLSGSYSNGVTLDLYQITLYNFASEQNLRREGNNLYSETAASGQPVSGAAGTGTFGTTEGYALEQSNADLAREFVNMITTQRGFQANSKSITTVDTMLETVISMKR